MDFGQALQAYYTALDLPIIVGVTLIVAMMQRGGLSDARAPWVVLALGVFSAFAVQVTDVTPYAFTLSNVFRRILIYSGGAALGHMLWRTLPPPIGPAPESPHAMKRT